VSLETKKTKIKELLNRKIITQLEHDKIIALLTELADDGEIIAAYKNIYNNCKKNTSKQLIAPKSAIYPDFSEDMIEPLDDHSYLISFYVDSENKNGVMLRTNIKCKIVNDKYEGTSFEIKKVKTRFGGSKITEEWSKFTKPKK
jgi:molecular chaperone GrpE (heat shock protein)